MLNNLFNIRKNRLRISNAFSVALLFCLSLFIGPQKCQAQYFGMGSGLGYYGTSFLWPLNSLMYSSGNSYAYGLGWPLYSLTHMGNRSINNSAANSYQNIPYNNYSNSPYTNNYTVGSTANPNAPFSYNNNINQNPTPVWNYSPNQSNTTFQQSNDPNDIFNYRYPSSGFVPVASGKGNLSVAPDRHTINQPVSEFSNISSNPAALEGFFNTINGHYKGNLVHALTQPDMQSWAESVGLIQPGQKLSKEISQTRKNQITDIVKDTSLDSQKKCDILHLLLQ
jgi:hypothetical protein